MCRFCPSTAGRTDATLVVVPLSFPASSWGVTKCLSWAQQEDKLRGAVKAAAWVRVLGFVFTFLEKLQ